MYNYPQISPRYPQENCKIMEILPQKHRSVTHM